MSWFGMLIVFIIVWWLVFFMALPFGVSASENPEAGHDPGAPVKPRLVIKALITTALAMTFTGALAVAADYGLIDIRELLF